MGLLSHERATYEKEGIATNRNTEQKHGFRRGVRRGKASERREIERLHDAPAPVDHKKEELAGDRFLKQAAAAWEVELRGTDFLARYGGEEFALALPGCTPEQAMPIEQVSPSGVAARRRAATSIARSGVQPGSARANSSPP